MTWRITNLAVVTETRLSEDVLSSEDSLLGYKLHRCDWLGFGYGDALIYKENNLRSAFVADCRERGTNCDILCAKVTVLNASTYTH